MITVPAKLLVAERNYFIATWDRVFLHVWHFELTTEALANLSRFSRAFVQENSEPISNLSIIEPSSPPPPEQLRNRLSAFYRELAPHTKHQLVVAEGGGFRLALIRSVGLALSALAPKSMPFRFTSRVEEAAALIGPYLSPTAGGAAGLLSAVAELRSSPALQPDRAARPR